MTSPAETRQRRGDAGDSKSLQSGAVHSMCRRFGRHAGVPARTDPSMREGTGIMLVGEWSPEETTRILHSFKNWKEEMRLPKDWKRPPM